MESKYYSVSYFDSLNGGSGLTKVEKRQLQYWLQSNPGFLIYRLAEG